MTLKAETENRASARIHGLAAIFVAAGAIVTFACSSSTHSGGPSSSDGGPRAEASSASTCDGLSASTSCETCTYTQCCTQVTDCQNDTDCGDYVSCVQNCGGTQNCANACSNQHPNGASDENALAACTSASCDAPCVGSSDSGSSDGASSDGNGSEIACGFGLFAPPLAACIRNNCCSENEVCAKDPACAQVVVCSTKCTGQSCTDTCLDGGTEVTVQEAQNVLNCWAMYCSTQDQ